MSTKFLTNHESRWKRSDDEEGEDRESLIRTEATRHETQEQTRYRNIGLFTALQTFVQILLCVLLASNLFAVLLRPPVRTVIVPPAAKTTLENTVAALFDVDTTAVLHTRFGSDASYMSLDAQYDWLWSSEADKYAGLVRLDPDDQAGPNGSWGAITMFHQLHCLSGLRAALQRAHVGVDIGLDYRNDTHWPHCLHYLRQSILCAADDTVERPYMWEASVAADGAVLGRKTGAIDGSSDLRVCRDADVLYRVRAERGYAAYRERMKVLEGGGEEKAVGGRL